MKIPTFLFAIFLFNFSMFSQNKKYYDAESTRSLEKSYNFYLISSDLDCLWINNKVYYFKSSPIDYLKGAATMIYDNVIIVPEIDRGYLLTWSLINNKLHIRDINIYRSDYETNLRPTNGESRNKLEDFLGRKFEGIGLYADFVTGRFMLYKYPVMLNKPGEKRDKYTAEEHKQYKKFIKKKQEIYSLELKNGELIKFSRDKITERKFKRDFDINAIEGPVM